MNNLQTQQATLRSQQTELQALSSDFSSLGTALSTVDSATRLFRDTSDEEAKLLKVMRQWAERASVGADAKAQMLFDWLKKTVRPGGKWARNC